jgi:hypothetical protein
LATYIPQKVDDAAFTPATDSVVPVGAMADEASPDSVNEGDIGIPRMSLNRALHVKVRDDAGNERGLNVDASGNANVAQATAASLNAQIVGSVAHDAADAGNPVKVGGKARQTNPTAVADADRVDGSFDDLGRQVIVPHQVRDLVSDQRTVITSSTAVTTIVTADASNMLDLVSLVMTNISATGSEVELYDDDGTTVRMTFYVPATDVRGIVFSVPFKQTAVNKTWKMKTVTSIASLKVTAHFVKNV